jgi:hypothetical protein
MALFFDMGTADVAIIADTDSCLRALTDLTKTTSSGQSDRSINRKPTRHDDPVLRRLRPPANAPDKASVKCMVLNKIMQC